MVELTYQGRKLRAPVWIQPGHVDGAVTLHLGYGRTKAGRAGTGMGFNPYGLRTSQALWQDIGPGSDQDSGQLPVARPLQNQHVLDTRRHIIHKGDLAEYLKDPESVHEGAETPPARADHVSGLRISKATRGAWLSTSTPVPDAAHAWWRARRKIISRWWAKTRCAADATCSGCASIPITTARVQRSARSTTSPFPACSARTRPASWSARCRPPPQRRRPQRHGLQPLRGHAVLLQQLPVQSAAVQFLPVLRLRNTQPEAAATIPMSRCAAAA